MATSYIIDFKQSSSKQEIKVVKEFIYSKNSENKIKKLFDALISQKERKFSHEELSSLLKGNSSAFRTLKSRLFGKVRFIQALISIATLQKHIERTSSYS